MTAATPWPRYPVVYEINARLWVRELRARGLEAPTLDDVPAEELEALARWGFDAVWLMGVWTVSAGPVAIARSDPGLRAEYDRVLPGWTEDDVIGSPYAIGDYVASAELGGPAALARFRERLAGLGLRLLLDFVPNHTALDHRLVREEPEVYVRGDEADLARDPVTFFRAPGGVVLAHGRDPYFPAWSDTAQVDPTRPPGREFLRRTLLALAEQCDGVRCDMAMLILPEVLQKTWGRWLSPSASRDSFWAETIPQLRGSRPEFLLLAEAYWDLDWRLQQEGFQFTYDKTLYDRLREGDAERVRAHLRAEETYQDQSARFTENHDEARAAAAFGSAGARTASVVSWCSPGLRLVHEGQLVGRRVKVPVQLGRRPPELVDEPLRRFYETLLGLVSEPVLKEGRWRPLEVRAAGPGDETARALLACAWQPRSGLARGAFLGFMVVANLSDREAFGRLALAGTGFQAGRRYELIDRCDGARYRREGAELVGSGLFVRLAPRQSHLFEVLRL